MAARRIWEKDLMAIFEADPAAKHSPAQLAEAMNKCVSTINAHLRDLENEQKIVREKIGYYCWWRLADVQQINVDTKKLITSRRWDKNLFSISDPTRPAISERQN